MNGLVIAGGKSNRMGMDKAMVCYHGLPQYQYVYNLLQTHCSHVLVSTNTINAGIDLPQLIDLPQHQHSGPIAALHTAFDYQCTDWLVVAIDYPLLANTDIAALITTPNTGQDASVYFNQNTNFYEPFIGIYHASFFYYLQQAETNNILSVQQILQQANVCKVLPAKTISLVNANTPQDYQNIIQLLK
jgi:molybdenum cofactor guanylyltransferase